MALTLTFVQRADLPEISRGGAKDQVTVHASGQISFSKSATETLGDVNAVSIGFEQATRTMYVVGCTETNVKKYKIKSENSFPVKTGKKSGTFIFAATSLLRATKVFGADGLYDYKSSGNQSFECKLDPKDNMVTFVLPAGGLTPREFTPRKARKAKDAGVETGTSTGAPGTGTPAESDVLTLSA